MAITATVVPSVISLRQRDLRDPQALVFINNTQTGDASGGNITVQSTIGGDGVLAILRAFARDTGATGTVQGIMVLTGESSYRMDIGTGGASGTNLGDIFREWGIWPAFYFPYSSGGTTPHVQMIISNVNTVVTRFEWVGFQYDRLSLQAEGGPLVPGTGLT